MNARLVALALRRVAPWWLAFGLAALGALAARSAASDDPAGAALARQGVWTVLLLAATLTLVPRAAGLSERFSTQEFGWVGAEPQSRARWYFSSLAGACAASLGASLIALALAEGSAQVDGPALREVALADVPERAVLDGREPVRWSVAASADETLRVELLFVAIEPSVDVEWRAERGGEVRSVRASLARPQAIEVRVPPGEGAVQLTLERTGAGGLALLSGERLQRLVSTGSARGASLALALHALLASMCWLALALGLAPWIGARLASAASLVAPLAAWSLGDEFASDATPLGALVRALDVCGRGLVPAGPGAAEFAACAACVVAGLALFTRGLGRARGRSA